MVWTWATTLLFYPAIIIVALQASFGPGILATLLSIIISRIWILPPMGEFSIQNPIEQISMVLFIITGVLISSVAELYRQNRRKVIAYDKEIALHESEERFQTLADNIPNLAWMANANGSIIWFNKQWYDYAGTTQEEMQGTGWQKVLHQDYVDKVTKTILRAFRK